MHIERQEGGFAASLTFWGSEETGFNFDLFCRMDQSWILVMFQSLLFDSLAKCLYKLYIFLMANRKSSTCKI